MNDHDRFHERPVRNRPRRRSSSVGRQSALQIRAGNLVKKLGILTSKLSAGATRIKLDSVNANNDTKQGDTEPENVNYPFRKTRSMDVLRSKPFVSSSPMLAVAGFQSQSLPRRSGDGSHESASASGSDVSEAAHIRRTSFTASGHGNATSSSIAHGRAVATLVAEASPRPPEASNTHPNGVPPPRLSNVSNDTNNTIKDINSGSLHPSPLHSKRQSHPRLATLPPLNFNLKSMPQDQGSTRFSPSVIVRPPAFPILELPALPTPVAETPASGSSQTDSRSRRGGPRLNSMPMLPMEGADERENDPDHENYGLDDDDEGDEDENEDGETGEAIASEEEEEEEEADANGRSASSATASPSPSASFFARTRALSPRLPMPSLPSPGFATLFGTSAGSSAGRSSGSERLSAGAGQVVHSGSASASAYVGTNRDELTTPKAGPGPGLPGSLNPIGRFEYFPTSDATGPAAAKEIVRTNYIDLTGQSYGSQSSYPHSPSAPSSSPSALRTPAAGAYSLSQTPMISIAPPPPSCSHLDVGVSESDARMLKDSLTPRGIDGTDLSVSYQNQSEFPKRPTIYHHASKSMIELFSTAAVASKHGTAAGAALERDIKGKGRLHSEEPLSVGGLQAIKTSTATKEMDTGTLRAPGSESNTTGLEKTLPAVPLGVPPPFEAAPSLRRQRSMPTFSTSGPPPPYPSFPLPVHMRHFAPLPREDEGKEVLPPYSNSLRLAAVMPRKMEFSAPGVPSRDRKWRRVHCVLEGTAFRVYDAPPRVTGVSALGGWWERKVGVGDLSAGLGVGASASSGATTNIIIGKKEAKRRMKWEEELQAEEAARAASERGSESTQTTTEVNLGLQPQGYKSKRHLAVSLLHPSRTRNLQSRTTSPGRVASPRSSFQTPRTSADSSTPPSARPSVDISTPASSSSALSSTAMGSARNSTSASSASIISTNSGIPVSVQSAETRRRGHLRADSSPCSGPPSRSHSHSRSESNPQTSLHPNLQSQSQSQSQSGASLKPNSNQASDSPEPDERDLLRVYSLQRAESGLASDYTKRKNVVRVRMEGEQFLLQCKDVASVVEWIEGLQAATNIALDLDERPMPKGPIFPRRRRRRRPQRTESSTDQPEAGTGAGAGPAANESGGS